MVLFKDDESFSSSLKYRNKKLDLISLKEIN
jgi:hypothetical protein